MSRDIFLMTRIDKPALFRQLFKHPRGIPSNPGGYKVHYWNEGASEIDFILEKSDQIIALEVKSGRRTSNIRAQASFRQEYPEAKFLVIGTGGISFEEFFAESPAKVFRM